jgi:hypothetical protein
MNVWSALKDPLQGKVSLAKVFWVYGVLGSLACSALGLFVDTDNRFADWTYSIVGVVFSIYVTVATYQCAGNCGSVFLARFVRISTLLSVFLIVPFFAYLYFSGALETLLTAMPSE